MEYIQKIFFNSFPIEFTYHFFFEKKIACLTVSFCFSRWTIKIIFFWERISYRHNYFRLHLMLELHISTYIAEYTKIPINISPLTSVLLTFQYYRCFIKDSCSIYSHNSFFSHLPVSFIVTYWSLRYKPLILLSYGISLIINFHSTQFAICNASLFICAIQYPNLSASLTSVTYWFLVLSFVCLLFVIS